MNEITDDSYCFCFVAHRRIAILEMHEYVTGLLKDYNAMQQEIKALKYELSHLDIGSEQETIESMTYSIPMGERIDGGGISNRTPDIALTYSQKHEGLKQQTLCEVSDRLRWLRVTTDRLDFYINSLEAHQASILRDYYFEGYTWRELQDLRGVSYKTLIKYRDEGVGALTIKYNNLKRIGLL